MVTTQAIAEKLLFLKDFPYNDVETRLADPFTPS